MLSMNPAACVSPTRTSACSNAADGATGSARTSTTVTESPRSISAAASREPMLPAPPVISACIELVSSVRGSLRMESAILPRGRSPRNRRAY